MNYYKQREEMTEIKEEERNDESINNNRKGSEKENRRYPICFDCKNRIQEKECVVLGQKKYHIQHFKCKKCNCSLAKKLFYEYRNSLYCEDDYKSQIAPKCHQCNIFIDGKYISAKNQCFHLQCFFCYHCQIELQPKEQFYFSADKVHLYCKKCKKRFSVNCHKCKKTINEDEEFIDGKYYHIQCLQCQKCKGEIEPDNFIIHKNKFIYHHYCVSKCHHCQEIIDDQSQITHYFDFILHQNCTTAYSKFVRINTINAFKKQNTSLNNNISSSQQIQQSQQLNSGQQKEQQQQQNQQQSMLDDKYKYSKQTSWSPENSSYTNQLESKFCNSIDQLNKQFSELKYQEVNFDTQIDFGSLSMRDKFDNNNNNNNSSLSSSNNNISNINIKQTFSIESKQSEEEIQSQSPKSKIDSLLSLPNSKDKQICLQGINLNANNKNSNNKNKNKSKKNVEIINSESDENFSD